MDQINICKFLDTLDAKRYDCLWYDRKTHFWNLSKQPNIVPSLFKFLKLEDLISEFDISACDGEYSPDVQLSSVVIRNFNKLKNSSFNIFRFNPLINSWVAEDDRDERNFNVISAPSFKKLILKLI